MSYMEQMRKLANKYIAGKQGEPVSAREIAAWMVDTQSWAPARAQLITQCADIIARALREDYFNDAQGRRARAKHALAEKRGDRQLHLWVDMRTASREQMELSLQQRRQQVLGDCVQLKVDTDSYNQNFNKGEPIQMVLNFTDDVAELEAVRPGAA